MENYSTIKINELLTTCYSMDEPWNHHAKWKKSAQKGHILDNSAYAKYPE